jgi:hypothetical protein
MALDDADKKFIGELIAAQLKPEALAAAVAPVVKAHTDAALKGVVTGDALKTQLDELAAKLKPAEPENKGGDGKGKDKEADPRLDAMAAKIKEMEAQSAAKDRLLAEEGAKARTKSLHDAAREALAAAGVPADRLPAALAYVKDLGVLDYDGDTAGWKGKTSLGLDGVLPMKDAAAAWVKAEGKLFLPPTNASGTGDGNRGAGSGPRNGGAISLEDLRKGGAGATLLNAMQNAQ